MPSLYAQAAMERAINLLHARTQHDYLIMFEEPLHRRYHVLELLPYNQLVCGPEVVEVSGMAGTARKKPEQPVRRVSGVVANMSFFVIPTCYASLL